MYLIIMLGSVGVIIIISSYIRRKVTEVLYQALESR